MMKQRWHLLLLGVMIFVTPLTASAHAELVSSSPARGETYQSIETAVFTFNEPVGTDSTLALINTDFQRTELSTVTDNQTIRAAVPPLEAGRYTIEFDVSSVDGHTILGSIQFAIMPTHLSLLPQIGVIVLGAMIGFAFFFLRHNRHR